MVLAVELLAVRLLIPFVGSGVEVMAIVISGVLLPLATGYHAGGTRMSRASCPRSVRRLLLRNLLNALLMLVPALSFAFMAGWFEAMVHVGIRHPLVQAAVYVGVFLVYPVFLLAQTVPLASHYFSRRMQSQTTGRMLFFSTLGSFLGSILSTLVLMNLIGVHLTAFVTLSLLGLAALLLLKRAHSYETVLIGGALIVMWLMNSPHALSRMGIVASNAYNTISVRSNTQEDSKELLLNFSRSSKFSAQPAYRYHYIRFLEDTVITPLLKAQVPKQQILVIGAGGFTLGWDDHKNHYTFVDIDPDLKHIAERHLLPEPLPQNKKFLAWSARRFVHQHRDRARYDVIVVDAFSNRDAVPLEVTTQEFWQDVDANLKPGGVLAANIIMSAAFTDRFSGRMMNTFSAVFPHHLRQVPYPFSIWSTSTQDNVMLVYKKQLASPDRTIYHDDLSPYSLDRYR